MKLRWLISNLLRAATGGAQTPKTAPKPLADSAEGYTNLGTTLGQKGDLDGAIVEYFTAIRLLPDFAAARYNLVVALKVKGDLEGAIAEFRTAIRIKPYDAMAHYNFGLVT